MTTTPGHNRSFTRSTCPREVFDQITDILAEMVLEDMKQNPRIPISLRIDRVSGRENTVLLSQEGGA